METATDRSDLGEIFTDFAIQSQLQRRKVVGRGWRRLLAAGLMLAAAPMAAAAEPCDGIPVPSIATSLPARGDPTGMRKWLSEDVVTYAVFYTSEALGND